jgi:hypothetical protein
MRLPGLNSQILLAAALGAMLGVYLNHQGAPDPNSAGLITALQFTGGLFVDLLKMVLIRWYSPRLPPGWPAWVNMNMPGASGASPSAIT